MPKQISNYLPLSITAISFIGLFDAFYLSAQKYLGTIPPCFITTGCDTVTRGPYSVLFGIPLAYLGLLYYIALFFLSVLYFNTDKKLPTIKALNFISGFGFLFSIYLVYLQIFVIEALCIYCIISATTTTLIFILSCYLESVLKKDLPIN